jgi:hypothetical protein
MCKSDVVATPIRVSGTHKWAHLEATNEEDLSFFARLFGKKIQRDNRGIHLDISEHEREVAIRKGCREGRINPPTLNRRFDDT